MKSYLIICFLLLLVSCKKEPSIAPIKKEANVQAVSAEIDSTTKDSTAIIENAVQRPHGNQIFSNSQKLRTLKYVNGYLLQSISVQECENTLDGLGEDDTYDHKITDIILKDGLFTVNFKVVENCCSHFLCEAEIENNTLNILYYPYGRFCSCECIFEMSFTFEIDQDMSDILEKTEIKYVMLNSYKETKTIFK